MMLKTSRIPLFNQKTLEERSLYLKDFADLSDEDFFILQKKEGISIQLANLILENVVSVMSLPLGIATNFIINGKDYLVPMALEEPSVIAASCYGAKLARLSGGFFVEQTSALMMGQIVLMNTTINFIKALTSIKQAQSLLLEQANACDPLLVSLGGGAQSLTVEKQETERGCMLVVQLFVDVKDAMGANIVNTMVERIAPLLEQITGGSARLKVVSNLATTRMVRASATWAKEELGPDVIEKILDAYAFAMVNTARAVTHNKGIMNGISAVALATGNDFRALEAGAHGYAVQHGFYRPLTHYAKNERGDLVGHLEMPLAVGIVGGVIKSHPVAQLSLKILGVQTAAELACVMGAVGLAQNFAALRALVTEGIQKGHMKCHSQNIALQVGASYMQAELIAQKMIQEKCITVKRAQELFLQLLAGEHL